LHYGIRFEPLTDAQLAEIEAKGEEVFPWEREPRFSWFDTEQERDEAMGDAEGVPAYLSCWPMREMVKVTR
jgi:hypothetical protein